MKISKFLFFTFILMIILFISACHDDRNLPLGLAPYLYVSSPSLEVNIIDTHSSETIFIEVDGSVVMIDTCANTSYSKIFEFLSSKRIEKIDYLIFTHLNEDYTDRANLLLEYIDIAHIVQSNIEQNPTSGHNKYDLGPFEIEYFNPREGFTLTINEAILTIHPLLSSNYNTNSPLITSLHYFDEGIIFTSDTNEEYLNQYLLLNDLQYTVILLPSGGLNHKILEVFLLSNTLSGIVMTCHDSKELDQNMLQLLGDHNIQTFFSCDGTISIRINHNDLNIIQVINKYYWE